MPASQALDYRPETRLVHGGTLRSQFGETSEALFLTQGYVYDSSEQAERALQERGAGLHLFALRQSDRRDVRGAHGGVRGRGSRARDRDRHGGGDASRCSASSRPATTWSRRKALFGSCRYVVEDFLPRYGIASTLVDGTDLDAWSKAVRPNTKAFFLESPTNPTLEIIDIAAVAKIAHEAGAHAGRRQRLRDAAVAVAARARRRLRRLFGDQAHRRPGPLPRRRRPRARRSSSQDNVHNLIRQTGPSISPFNAWVLLKGLETLSVRVHRADRDRGDVADVLAEHPKVTRTDLSRARATIRRRRSRKKQMRGGSTLVAFEVEGGKDGAFRFQDALKLIRISNNLGDAKSLITHPATTTHQRLGADARAELGITDGMVRLSCGLEHQDDVVADLLGALEKV